MSDLPEKMWLQTQHTLDEYEFTHCRDKINDDDTEYIRADLNNVEWISIHNKKPEYDKTVIVYRCGEWGQNICFASRKSRGSMLADFWLEHKGEGRAPQHDITHWMPYPEPPKN